MSPIGVRLTIKGEVEETTFGLFLKKDGYWLRPSDNSSSSQEIKLKQDDGLFSIDNKDYGLFEETKDVIDERLVGLSESFLESNAQGIEDDGVTEIPDRRPGYGPNDIYVENKPFSLSQLLEMIKDGDLELTPNFQRNFIWDRTRRSRLIESILLGLPLPSIYLSQYDDGRLTIVDGLQRISSIKEFLEDRLVLCNMEYFTDCNGKKYSQLSTVLPLLQLRRFKQAQIMCFVIDYRSPSKLKYDLFRRLNTGGKPLNNQEIRNCLSRVSLQKTLQDMSSSNTFKNVTGSSLTDTRLAAQEMALRFIYFYKHYNNGDPTTNYNGDMDDTLDGFVDELNTLKEDKLSAYSKLYENSLEMAYGLFGTYAFRKVEKYYQNAKKSPINKLLMLVITVLLAYHKNDYINAIENKNPGFLTPHLAELLSTNPQLFYAITWSTNSKRNIEFVFRCIKEELFDKYLLHE